MTACISFLFDHKELIASFLVGLLGLVKLTAWGRSQAAALDAVVHVIEGLDASEVKGAVAAKQESLPAGAKDAIKDAVFTADPKKPTPGLAERIFREMFRFGK